MGYSRENKRHNEALQTILDGGTPEKRIYIANIMNAEIIRDAN